MPFAHHRSETRQTRTNTDSMGSLTTSNTSNKPAHSANCATGHQPDPPVDPTTVPAGTP